MQSARVSEYTDDQRRINFALYESNLEWSLSEGLEDSVIVGATKNGTTRVASLPERYICRKTCDLASMSEYYIWHQSGGSHEAKTKSEQNTVSQMWFLRSNDYKVLTGLGATAAAVQWLEEISNPVAIKNNRRRLNSSVSQEHT